MPLTKIASQTSLSSTEWLKCDRKIENNATQISASPR